MGLFSEVAFVEEKVKLKNIKIIFIVHKQNPFTKISSLGRKKIKEKNELKKQSFSLLSFVEKNPENFNQFSL